MPISDMRVRSPRDHDESDPGEDDSKPREGRDGDVFCAARADPRPENARDQKTEKRQEDDQLVHRSQPFNELMSSTAIEPRLR